MLYICIISNKLDLNQAKRVSHTKATYYHVFAAVKVFISLAYKCQSYKQFLHN